MKIDRRDPLHWWLLLASGAMALLALASRPFRRRGGAPVVALHGHRLGGNLEALLRALHADGIEAAFIALDPAEVRRLRAAGEPVVAGASPACARLLARADVLVTDHGLLAYEPLLWWSDLRFVDVWHGIPFKGFDAGDFRAQHRYDEVWVSSPALRRMYVERFEFRGDRVFATGYARTDRLVRRGEDVAELRGKFGLPPAGPVVLFAPTWKQDAAGRSLYPFGLDETAFLSALRAVAERHGATVAMRAHLNSGGGAAHDGVVQVPFADHPDTEGLLLCTDVLVCDWSSIAFDFLLLERPAIFLDVPPPFAKGFSLGPEHRYGPVVGGMDALCATLDTALAAPAAAIEPFSAARAAASAVAYGDRADGDAAARGAVRLRSLTAAGSSR